MVNMKRLIALLLAAVLALSLVACGGESSMTQEEMLEVAEEKEFTDLLLEIKRMLKVVSEMYIK